MQGGKERRPKIRSETGITIRDNNLGEAFLGVDVVNEDVGQLLGGDGLVGSDEEGLFGEHTDKSDDGVVGEGVVAEGRRKIGDQIGGDVGPGALRDGVGLKEARGAT